MNVVTLSVFCCKMCFYNLDISAFTVHPVDLLRCLTSIVFDQSVNYMCFRVVRSVWT